jgi:hypothetical protein
MSEKTIDQDTVRQEHLAEVHQSAHWAYLFGVILGTTLVMLAFIAWLGASSA